uniref:tRNA pseudouridine(55) synthase n=1 Tax=Oryza brachyantha TaxID=4533 RepID=J3M387_ORYBR
MGKLAAVGRSILRFTNESMRIVMVTIIGVLFGFFIGISFPSVSITKLHFPSSFVSYIEDRNSGLTTQALLNHAWTSARNARENSSEPSSSTTFKIYVPTNPKGAERLAPGIVVPESDFHLRRLWGEPSEDLPFKPKYLVTFTVGYAQKENINKAVKKFSDNFAILLFHYDDRVSEWDEFEWSKRAIHISARKQTKWWYAKRFLHPDIVAAYEYIFIWDEDLGVEHFNAEEYIKLVKKYRLDISQPGLEPDRGLTWQMTKRRGDREVHKVTEERPGWCSDPHLPPCAAFVEIMAPVFSRDAWRCVWHMIQNDLVHGWGLDFALRKCVEPAHEKIGVVDSQWIVHQVVPSLGNQGLVFFDDDKKDDEGEVKKKGGDDKGEVLERKVEDFFRSLKKGPGQGEAKAKKKEAEPPQVKPEEWPQPYLASRTTELPPRWNGPTGTVVLIDKPKGWTSFTVCGKLRRLVNVQKVGHAGTLDPMATGLLIVCVGKATKVVDRYQAMVKGYSGVFRLGEATSTWDADSPVIQREPWEHIKDEHIRKAAASFMGEIWQVPPMFSAIKVGGEKMYDKARRGESVELSPRRISIYSFDIERSLEDRQNLIFRVTCSKGTYIRSLCADLGKALGSCAHLTALRRDSIGDYSVNDAWSFSELEEQITKGYL